MMHPAKSWTLIKNLGKPYKPLTKPNKTTNPPSKPLYTFNNDEPKKRSDNAIRNLLNTAKVPST